MFQKCKPVPTWINVVGLGFGDEGKGTIIDYLSKQTSAKAIVRFNGGSQAAHHVVSEKGVVHCFSQLASGSMHQETETYLSRFMMFDPLAFIAEMDTFHEKGFSSLEDRIFLDKECLLVTPFHKILNRVKEIARGNTHHGSCGKGVGEAYMDSLKRNYPIPRVKDLFEPNTLYRKLSLLQMLKLDIANQIAEESEHRKLIKEEVASVAGKSFLSSYIELLHDFRDSHKVQFVTSEEMESRWVSQENILAEGAQGALLDADFGCWPHVTPSKTNLDQVYQLHSSMKTRFDYRNIGVFRAYSTRHGAGPFSTNDQELTEMIPDQHNGSNRWQGDFRVGWFDLVLARYALEITKDIDEVAVTNIDRLSGFTNVKVCTHYQYKGSEENLDEYFELEEVDGTPLIRGIRFVEQPDRERQAYLALLLLDCKPIYKHFQGWEQSRNMGNGEAFDEHLEHYLGFLSSEAGFDRPITICSFGPTVSDKVNRKVCRELLEMKCVKEGSGVV